MEEGRHKTSKSAIINLSGCKTFEFFPSFLLLCKRFFPGIDKIIRINRCCIQSAIASLTLDNDQFHSCLVTTPYMILVKISAHELLSNVSKELSPYLIIVTMPELRD